ncbi:MAG: 4Fe-4S dicluster domain-containing protein, partial [Betaproteobacteria bacterium]
FGRYGHYNTARGGFMGIDTGQPARPSVGAEPAHEVATGDRVPIECGTPARRRFLLGSGAVGIAAALRPGWIVAATVQGIPNSEGFLLVDMKKCQGCGTCMLMCSLAHAGEASYSLSRIQIQQDSFADWPNDIHIGQCHQCPDAPCVEACPVEPIKANKPNPKFGNVRMIDPELCIGCEACIEACPFTPSRAQWNHVGEVSQKCDLCVATPYLGAVGGPGGVQACVQSCPVGAIAFSRNTPKVNTEESYTVDLRGPVWKKLGMTTE